MRPLLLAALIAATLAGCGDDQADVPAKPPTTAADATEAKRLCEDWQNAGGTGSVSISTPEGDTTCVGVEP